MLGTKWLKGNTTSWDLTFGILNIQGYKFKLDEEEDLPNYCRKIVVTEDVIVPAHTRKTVTGLVLISSARVVNVPDWLTRHRMIHPWVQILHSLVDNRASNMALMIVNDSEEYYLCKSGELVTTMIPDPMGLVGWYGEEQASQVHRDAPLDYVGFTSPLKIRAKSLALNPHIDLQGIIKSTVNDTDAERKSCSSVRVVDSVEVNSDLKDLTIVEVSETSSIVIQDVVSDQIIQAVESCVIEEIKKEKVKRKRHRAVYLDLTNSSSESDQDINAASIILDIPSFYAKVKMKPKTSLPPSSSPDTVSSILYSSGHDTDALHSISLNSINNDYPDS